MKVCMYVFAFSLSMSEVIVIRKGETCGSGHIAAYTTRTVVTCTGASIACLYAMLADVIGKETLIVMKLGFSAVPHITDSNHPMRCKGKLQKSISPVTLVLLCGQVLQFTSQCRLWRELILAVGNEDVAVNHSAMSLYSELIVLLVQIHQAELEGLGELTCQGDINAPVIGLVAPLEELRGVAVGLGNQVVPRVELSVDGSDV